VKDLLVKNIFQSFIEKAGIMIIQFLISLIMIRNLEREMFGVIAIVGGSFALTNFINFPLENFLLKEEKNKKENLNRSLNQYLTFSFGKVLLFVAIALISTCFIVYKNYSMNYLCAIWSCCFVLILDTMASPFIFLSSVLLQQKLITRISFIRWTLSILLLLPLFYSQSLVWVLIKDIIVCIVTLSCWIFQTRKHFGIDTKIEKLDINEAWEKFKAFTLWTHLIGAITNIIYKADAVVLSWFASLSTVGNYNIALNAGNMANVIPSLLAYQNSVALSYADTPEKSHRLTIRFFRLTLYISAFTLLGYLLLGSFYLKLLTGQSENPEINLYMINIVIGILIVKTLISPMVSFINIKGNVKSLFMKVKLPLLFISFINYVLFAKFAGALGLSLANVINAFLWVFLIMLEIRQYQFKIKDVFNIKEDLRDIKHYAQNIKLLH
jgi:O-antigen/teichoic acid export membrane protein